MDSSNGINQLRRLGKQKDVEIINQKNVYGHRLKPCLQTKIKVMRRITVEEKHMIRKAQRDAQKIRMMMLMDGVYKYKMTPNLILRPSAFCSHIFTKGNDTE